MTIEPPKRIEVDQEELEAILAAVKPSLNPAQYTILESAIKMLIWLQMVVKEKSISIARLTRMFFAKKTENLKNIKERSKTKADSDDPGSDNDRPDESEQASDREADIDQKNKADSSSNDPSENERKHNDGSNENLSYNGFQRDFQKQPSADQNSNNSPSEDEPQSPAKKKNHGRRPLDDYNISKITYIPHDCLHVGQKCPLCLKTQPKADMSARAIVCLAKYQLGTPLYRLETWQKIMKLPISDSEMWEWTESVALVLNPVHQALLSIAAKGDVIHNDDTTGKILDLMEENRQVELAKKNSDDTDKNAEKHRKGIFTTDLPHKIKLSSPKYRVNE